MTIGIYYGHLVIFIPIWQFSGNIVYIPRFGTLCKEKSGNPGPQSKQTLEIHVRTEEDISSFIFLMMTMFHQSNYGRLFLSFLQKII
jgi:hypothetical protein